MSAQNVLVKIRRKIITLFNVLMKQLIGLTYIENCANEFIQCDVYLIILVEKLHKFNYEFYLGNGISLDLDNCSPTKNK